MHVSVLDVSSVGDHVPLSHRGVTLGAAAEHQGMSRGQLVAVFVGIVNEGTSADGGVGLLLAAGEDVGAGGVFSGESGRLDTDDFSGLVGLFLTGLSDKKIIVGLLQVEFRDSELVRCIIEALLELGDHCVRVVESRVCLYICILHSS